MHSGHKVQLDEKSCSNLLGQSLNVMNSTTAMNKSSKGCSKDEKPTKSLKDRYFESCSHCTSARLNSASRGHSRQLKLKMHYSSTEAISPVRYHGHRSNHGEKSHHHRTCTSLSKNLETHKSSPKIKGQLSASQTNDVNKTTKPIEKTKKQQPSSLLQKQP